MLTHKFMPDNHLAGGFETQLKSGQQVEYS